MVDEEKSKELNKYFNSKKFYLKIGLVIFSVVCVLIVYQKIKRKYTS